MLIFFVSNGGSSGRFLAFVRMTPVTDSRAAAAAAAASVAALATRRSSSISIAVVIVFPEPDGVGSC